MYTHMYIHIRMCMYVLCCVAGTGVGETGSELLEKRARLYVYIYIYICMYIYIV